MKNIVTQTDGSLWFDDDENKWLCCNFHITEKGELEVVVDQDRSNKFILSSKDATRLRIFLEEYGF